MLDEEGQKNLFKNVHDNWIDPELKRRWPDGDIPGTFKIRDCLILLPPDQPPVVKFNEEVGWDATFSKRPGVAFEKGTEVYPDQIEDVISVRPPTYEGKRVAFFFLFFYRGRFHVVFDTTPNFSDVVPEDPEKWSLSQPIVEKIRGYLIDQITSVPQSTIDGLEDIGMWPAPALLPYPINVINGQVDRGERVAAKEILLSHCSDSFIQSIVAKWVDVPSFTSRSELFKQSVDALQQGYFALVVYALIPQIEGIVSDWLYDRDPPLVVPYRQESKTKLFRQAIEPYTRTSGEKRILNVVIDFILNGPMLQRFDDWNAVVNSAFPGRHVIGHGKYDLAINSREAAVKIFLLVDTLYFLVNLERY